MSKGKIPVISTAIIEDCMDCLRDDPIIDESCELLLELSSQYNEFFNEIEMEIAKVDECVLQKYEEFKTIHQQKRHKVPMLIANRFVELKDLTTLVELKKDCTQLLKLQYLLNEEQCDLKAKYGDNVLEITANIISRYINEYQFKILKVTEFDNHISLCINFIIYDKVIANYPVQIDIDKNIHKVVDVNTNIYSREKLLTWLNKNNRNVTDLLANLRKTLIGILK